MIITDIIAGFMLAIGAGTATALAIIAAPVVRDARSILRRRSR